MSSMSFYSFFYDFMLFLPVCHLTTHIWTNLRICYNQRYKTEHSPVPTDASTGENQRPFTFLLFLGFLIAVYYILPRWEMGLDEGFYHEPNTNGRRPRTEAQEHRKNFYHEQTRTGLSYRCAPHFSYNFRLIFPSFPVLAGIVCLFSFHCNNVFSWV